MGPRDRRSYRGIAGTIRPVDDPVNPFRSDPTPSSEPPSPDAANQGWQAPEPAGTPQSSADPQDDPSEPSRTTEPDDVAEVELDEAALLDQLESDLAAVETAIASIEQIATDSVGGDQAAAEIRAAVSAERFGS